MEWLRKLFGRETEVPADTCMFSKDAGGLYVLRISGMLNKATVDRIQAVAARDIEGGAKELRVMVKLENFSGWRSSANWGDLDFFSRYEQFIRKIAVVGNAKWEADSLVFLASGHRKGEVRYFLTESETEARAWLA